MKRHLTEANAADAALLRELTLACWSGRVDRSSSAFRETEHDIRRELATGGAFILWLGNEAIASVRWRNFGPAWEMARLGVLPVFRQQGHAQILCAAVADRAVREGARELRIGIRRDQPRLVDLYADMGFELADDFTYSHANPLEPPPFLMRRRLT